MEAEEDEYPNPNFQSQFSGEGDPGALALIRAAYTVVPVRLVTGVDNSKTIILLTMPTTGPGKAAMIEVPPDKTVAEMLATLREATGWNVVVTKKDHPVYERERHRIE